MFTLIILLAIGGYADSNIPCPNYWITFGNSCYQFSTFKTTWFHAAKNCSDAGGHLVNIESQQENIFLTNTVAKLHEHQDLTYANYWTSGNDLAVDGSWIWGYPEGSPFTFTSWYPGEPNNFHHQDANSEECMQLRGIVHFAWNDILCTEDDFFICEIEDPEIVVG